MRPHTRNQLREVTTKGLKQKQGDSGRGHYNYHQEELNEIRAMMEIV